MVSITTRSCTISTPIEILPYTDLSSSLSHNNFTITIVLEKVNQIAINKLVVTGYPSTTDIMYAIPILAKICIEPTPKATLPCSLITFTFNSTPTMNNNNAIHSSAKSSKNVCPDSLVSTRPKNKGPTMIHATKYPMIKGCFNSFPIPAIQITTNKIIAN